MICFVSSLAWAQDTLSLKEETTGTIVTVTCRFPSPETQPNFVVFFRDKQLKLSIDSKRNHVDDGFFINPMDIKEMNLIKGIAATDKYGSFGDQGVVEIWLKQKAFKDLPQKIKAQFQTMKD